jgi:hypothetical protein
VCVRGRLMPGDSGNIFEVITAVITAMTFYVAVDLDTCLSVALIAPSVESETARRIYTPVMLSMKYFCFWTRRLLRASCI